MHPNKNTEKNQYNILNTMPRTQLVLNKCKLFSLHISKFGTQKIPCIDGPIDNTGYWQAPRNVRILFLCVWTQLQNLSQY